MAETLKLCVSCKACRRECPTGVDMARMKIEVQAARAAKSRPVAARPAGRLAAALCAVRRASCRGCSICATVCRARRSCRKRSPASRARRTLPRWRRDVFRRSTQPVGPRDGREVVLFADTFNRYFERGESRRRARGAGRRRLPRACRASRPRRARPLCCGRTFLSVGAVDEARARSRARARRACAVRRARRAGARARAELHPRLPRRNSRR